MASIMSHKREKEESPDWRVRFCDYDAPHLRGGWLSIESKNNGDEITFHEVTLADVETLIAQLQATLVKVAA